MGRPAILKVDIIADAKGVGKGVDEADAKLSKLGGGAKKAGLAIGAGLAVGAVAVGAFAKSAISAASDAEQSFGAVESVFGKASDQVKRYANDASVAVGLSKADYASLAAVVGSQLQGMGVEQDKSAGKTNDLIKTGADLAATFGGSVSDAVGAVGSLLRGERDPIEKYGVSITAADVAARLAANGQSKLEGAALKTAQAQATLTLLTEKTKNATGAFGRESDTLAGQQQRLGAQFDNVKASVGEKLLPALTATLGFVGSTVLPRLQQLGAELATKLGPAFSQVADFVRTRVLPAAQQLAGFFAAQLVPAFQQVAGFIGANVIPVLTALAGFVVGRVIPAFLTVANAVLPAIRSAFASVSTAVNGNRENLSKIGGVLTVVGSIMQKLAPVVGVVLAGAFRTAGAVIGGIVGIIGGVIGAVERALSAISSLADAAGKVGSVVGKLNPFKGGGPPLATGAPALVGGVNLGPTSTGLTTAAFGDSLAFDALGSRSLTGGLVVVDRRTIDARVTVSTALLDGSAVDQLTRAMRDQAIRLGRSTAYGAA